MLMNKGNMHKLKKKITKWQQFGRIVRSQGCNLLKELHKFPDAILITGCQRSGTTLMARIIFQSEDMVNYWVGRDDELDAALILSGYVNHEPRGRYCFQTTFLNECYTEYARELKDQKVIFLLRNPMSVVYSLVYNWAGFALKELFNSCGVNQMTDREKQRFDKFGIIAIPKIRRACYSYNGKISQVFELVVQLGKDKIIIIDYDELVTNKEKSLKNIFSFLGLKYKEEYCLKIHSSSVKKADKLGEKKINIIDEISMPIYMEARKLLTFPE